MPSERGARLPEPFIFLLDRCLGTNTVPGVLAPALLEREELRLLDDDYAQDAPDEEWIPEVGAKGWIILTKDKELQRRPNELAAWLAASTAVFVFTTGHVTGETIGRALAVALPSIRKAIRRFKPPLLGRVSLAGDVVVAYSDGVRLDPPKRVKPPRVRA